MGVHVFNNESKKLNEGVINDSYAMYLHKFIEACDEGFVNDNKDNCAIMSYDEFKEYYILKVLGRSKEFTENMARDYQFMSFDNILQMNALS